jgi:hypothetical protein
VAYTGLSFRGGINNFPNRQPTRHCCGCRRQTLSPLAIGHQLPSTGGGLGHMCLKPSADLSREQNASFPKDSTECVLVSVCTTIGLYTEALAPWSRLRSQGSISGRVSLRATLCCLWVWQPEDPSSPRTMQPEMSCALHETWATVTSGRGLRTWVQCTGAV